MNIFKFDSPVMNFISKVTDMVILNVLCLVMSLPIVTFGAAYTAKYYVSMKIVKGEETTVFKPYFKSFKENFKQSTKAWFIMLIPMVLVVLDWVWIFNKGFKNVSNIYLIGAGFFSCIVIFVVMTVFPFIARFEITLKEAFKGSVIFSILYFIKLILIVALEIITVIASIWYARWLPLLLLFGTTSAFYFLNVVLIKGFNRLEANMPKPEENEEGEIASDEEKEESYTVLRPDEHTLKGKIEAEKETVKGLSTKEKIQFFKDYYLLKTVVIILAVIFAIWFIYDAFLGKKETVYSGGLLYCNVTDEGMTHLTDDLLPVLSDNTRKKQVNLSNDMSFDYNDEEHEITPDPSQDQMLWPMIMAGYYDYFIVDAAVIDHYEQLDCYKDISKYALSYSIAEEDCKYALPPSEETTKITETEEKEESETSEETYINAIKLSDKVMEKAGIVSRSGEGAYLLLVRNNKDEALDDAFMDYIFSE